MPEEATTTVVSASPAPEHGAPQATEQPAQASVQPQGTPAQVEDRTKLQPGNEVRPFERMAGRKLDRIDRGFEKLFTLLEKNQAPQPSAPSPNAQTPLTDEEFLSSPVKSSRMIIDEIVAQIKGEIPKTLSEQARQMDFQRSQKDALKMIETNELVSKDPEGMNKIEDIFNDPEDGLAEIASKYPLYAAKLALKIYSEKYGKAAPSAAAPTKAQMVATATAVHPTGKVTLKDEAVELQKQLLNNPELRYDREFIKKLQSLKDRRQAELVA